ncbi:hypothetical protein Dimus_014618 [Dionaea muscipula]
MRAPGGWGNLFAPERNIRILFYAQPQRSDISPKSKFIFLARLEFKHEEEYRLHCTQELVRSIMGHRTESLSSSRLLEGVHGVHMVPHASFCLEEIPVQHGDHNQLTLQSSTTGLGQQQQLLTPRLWQQRSPDCLAPIHCCLSGDQTLAETVSNVITSLPFIALGINAPRKNLNCKLYANSLIGVGVASSLYHSSRGRLRRYFKWLDYTMIAAASMCLSRAALENESPCKLLMAASALCLPFQPLVVSVVHTGMMEVAFAKRAMENPELRMSHKMHKLSWLLGGILFVAEDMLPTTPFIHAAWHLAAAVGVATCNKLLE